MVIYLPQARVAVTEFASDFRYFRKRTSLQSLSILHSIVVKFLCLVPVGRLTVLIDVESFLFDAFVYAESYCCIDKFEQDEGHDGTEDDGYYRGDDLYPQLMPVSIQGSLYTPFAGDALRGKDTGKDRPDDATDAMYSECVERIVIAELGFDDSYHAEADGGGDDTDAESTWQIDRACCRRDGY